MVIFPGVREELIERALRKLAVHKLASLQVQPNATDQGTAVTIVFSLHQLRQELEQTGHGFNLAQISEGLEVMHLCNVAVECSGDSIVHKKKGPILPTLEIVADPADVDGKRMLYRASFHPLASAAILGELYFPVNYIRCTQEHFTQEWPVTSAYRDFLVKLTLLNPRSKRPRQWREQLWFHFMRPTRL